MSSSKPAKFSEELAIREARRTQNHALAIGDAKRAAEFWTEDVTLRRAFGQAVMGRDAYRQCPALARGAPSACDN